MYVALITAFLAGCASNNVSDNKSNAGGTTDNQPEKVTLRFSWWGAQERNQATLEAIDLYMQQNPHVNIQAEYMDYAGFYEKLVAQFAGGTAPDVIAIVDRWFYDLAGKNQFLADLGQYVDLIDFSTVDPDFMKTQEYQGKKVGFPAGLQGAVMLYNKDFFERYNIPEDTKWTWENIIEIGKKVHEQDSNAYLISTDSGELDTLLRTYQKQLTGNQFIQDDYTLGFTETDMVKMLTFVKDLYDNHVAEPLSSAVLYLNKSNENPKWINGEMGMQYKLVSLIPNYQKIDNFELGVTALPVMEDESAMKDPGTFNGSTLHFVMNAKTKYPEESAKFINWLVNDPEAIKILNSTRGVPATAKAREILLNENMIDPMVNEALNISLANSSKVLPDNAISQNQELYAIFLDMIDRVGFGEVSPEEGAKQLIQLLEDKLAEIKNIEG